VPILDWDPGTSPEAPGTLMFYEQGSDPSTGFRVSSKGAILSALSAAWSAATATAVVASAIVTGDTFDRWRLRADGRMDWGPGDGARDVSLYRSAANVLKTDDAFVASLGLQLPEGQSSSRMGRATLVAGTVTVSNTNVTASSEIFLTCQVTGGTRGALAVTARTAGTSFTITSTSATDTSQVAWFIVEPAS